MNLWWKSSTRLVALSCTMYMDGADCRATNELCCAESVEAQAVFFSEYSPSKLFLKAPGIQKMALFRSSEDYRLSSGTNAPEVDNAWLAPECQVDDAAPEVGQCSGHEEQW